MAVFLSGSDPMLKKDGLLAFFSTPPLYAFLLVSLKIYHILRTLDFSRSIFLPTKLSHKLMPTNFSTNVVGTKNVFSA